MGQLKLNGLQALEDKQLTTPKHDELMFYLAKKENDEYLNLRQLLLKTNLIALELIYKFRIKRMEFEKPLIGERGLIGVIDCAVEIEFIGENELTSFSLLIEIKPKIESVGEVLRQLNIYKQYRNIFFCNRGTYYNSRIVLFTPTEQYREFFESQDIIYLSLESLGVLE